MGRARRRHRHRDRTASATTTRHVPVAACGGCGRRTDGCGRRTLNGARDGRLARLGRHRRQQAEARLLAGPRWVDHDLVLATRTGNPVMPRSFDRTLAVLVQRAGLPRLSSHGLRHTAASHMVRSAGDLGELRAVADVLGHSPEILLRVYAHALPDSLRSVADRIGQRSTPRTGTQPDDSS